MFGCLAKGGSERGPGFFYLNCRPERGGLWFGTFPQTKLSFGGGMEVTYGGGGPKEGQVPMDKNGRILSSEEVAMLEKAGKYRL